jgi:hypothetical protein
MANFNTHLSGAVTISALSTGFLFNSNFVDNPIELIPCSLLGVVGGFLPDIDSDNSTSARYAFNLLAVSLAFFNIIQLFNHLTLFQLAFLSFSIIIFIRIILFWIFKKLTVHRGIIHSVPCGILFSLITIYFMQKVPFASDEIAFSSGVIIFLGYITHLVLDELYSFNLSGLELKRSFGTALKFIRIGDLIPSIIVYACIIFTLINISNFNDLFYKFISLL